MSTKRITRIALFTALALIMSLLESYLPPLLPFAPGAKMGLANVITLMAIILLGDVDAAIIQIIRCTLGAVIAGNVLGLMFSLPAGILSLITMIVLYRLVFPKISLMGISFVGAVVHNTTQVFVASILLKTNLALMLVNMLLASVLAGLFVGITAFFVIKYLPKRAYTD